MRAAKSAFVCAWASEAPVLLCSVLGKVVKSWQAISTPGQASPAALTVKAMNGLLFLSENSTKTFVSKLCKTVHFRFSSSSSVQLLTYMQRKGSGLFTSLLGLGDPPSCSASALCSCGFSSPQRALCAAGWQAKCLWNVSAVSWGVGGSG